MTLYLNNPIYLHNSVRSSFSNLTKALEHQNESDAKTIDNCGSALENHTFDSLTNLIREYDKLKFIFKKGEDEGAVGGEEGGPGGPAGAAAPAPLEVVAGTTVKTVEETVIGGGRVKRTRNLRNKGNNKSQKQRKRKHLNYTKK